MQLLCLGDIALTDKSLVDKMWVTPNNLTPGKDMKIMFNWEFPIGDRINPKPRVRGNRYLAYPDSPRVIQNWAPGIATVATNHILDADEVGLACTLKSLHQSDFMTVGAGMTSKEATQPVFWETQEGRLAIVNWVFPESHPDWMVVPGPNCWPGIEDAKNIIQSLKQDSDWVLVVAHWSDELFPYPRPEDRKTAHGLAQIGADVVIGHHPHVVRGVDIIGAGPVFYSIGYFYFSSIPDDRGGWLSRQAPRNREGLGVQLSFQRGKSPEYKIFSFYNSGRRVIHDPFLRAKIRFARVNRPLRRFNNGSYARWYSSKRARFDKWWSLWFFGVLRFGIRGSFQRILQKFESRFLINPK